MEACEQTSQNCTAAKGSTERMAFEERILKAFDDIPRNARAWIRVWNDLTTALDNSHGTRDLSSDLTNRIISDKSLDGYIPEHPDKEWLEDVFEILNATAY